MSQTRQPNILIVMIDQHRPDRAGFGGNRVVLTPHLDVRAKKSMRSLMETNDLSPKPTAFV